MSNVAVNPDTSVKQEVINQTLPVAFLSESESTDPLTWVLQNRQIFEDNLHQYAAVLLRGFKKYSIEEFESFIEKSSGNLLSYRNRSTPRSILSGKIYTSTEYPSDQTIAQHNESSYTHERPGRVFFCCIQSALTGGETPISDSRKVLNRIPSEIVERFDRDGIMYVRTFTPGLGLTWQETFQMSDRIQLQKYCQKHNIFLDWLSDGRLRMKQTLQATIAHPITGERSWFNQAHLFHASALTPEIRAELEKNVPADEMPRNSFYGNGDPISDEALDCIRQAYDQEESAFTWQQGDILIVDNILAAHGRNPFTGERKIVVGMT